MRARILTDPLFAFLLLGGACFLLWETLAQEPAPETIVVSREMITALQEEYLLLEGRAPDAEARARLIGRLIRDEVLFREALARGLHLNDARLRHRLIDKLRFLLTEAPDPPSPEQLLDHYLEHAERYYTEPLISFEHRFFAPGTAVPDDALAKLQVGDDVAGDDPFWVGERFDRYHATMVRSIFGVEFAEALVAATPGEWFGPVASARGMHLARIEALEPPRLLPFEAARARLEQDWIDARQQQSLDAQLEPLMNGYLIRVED